MITVFGAGANGCGGGTKSSFSDSSESGSFFLQQSFTAVSHCMYFYYYGMFIDDQNMGFLSKDS